MILLFTQSPCYSPATAYGIYTVFECSKSIDIGCVTFKGTVGIAGGIGWHSYFLRNSIGVFLRSFYFKTGFIYTMNVTAEDMHNRGYDWHFNLNDTYMKMIFGAVESLFCCDTYQFADYSKMAAERYNAEKKAERRQTVFPEDCTKAYEMGVRCTQPLE